jgi:hypothetical protein
MDKVCIFVMIMDRFNRVLASIKISFFLILKYLFNDPKEDDILIVFLGNFCEGCMGIGFLIFNVKNRP